MIQVIAQHRLGESELVGELKSPIEITGDFQGTKSDICSFSPIPELLTNVTFM
jgi:hypothetical protein